MDTPDRKLHGASSKSSATLRGLDPISELFIGQKWPHYTSSTNEHSRNETLALLCLRVNQRRFLFASEGDKRKRNPKVDGNKRIGAIFMPTGVDREGDAAATMSDW